MKKTKIIALVLALCTVFSMFSSVFAYDETFENGLLIAPNPMNNSIKVLMNYSTIDFSDENGNVVEPQIMNNRTMVPMRKIFEVFGVNVEWDGDTKTITATTAEKELKLQIDNKTATVKASGDDSAEEISLDAAPVIYNNRTMVPVRFIAESLELHVGWVPETKTVVILDTDFIFEKIKKNAPNFYEFITTEYVTPETLESAMKLTATVNYKDENKSLTNLKTVVNGTIKKDENYNMDIDFTAKTTGKGELLDTLKENGFDNITFKEIVDMQNFIAYVKSSMIEENVGSKWLKMDMSDSLSSYTGLTDTSITYKEFVDLLFDEVTLTESTYEEVDKLVDLLCKFVSDKYFTVSGRTTKTYTYELTLDDVLKILELDMTKEDLKDAGELADASIKISAKISDNYVKDFSIDMQVSLAEDEETVDIKLDYIQTVQSFNEKVTINMPSDRNTVDIKDL